MLIVPLRVIWRIMQCYLSSLVAPQNNSSTSGSFPTDYIEISDDEDTPLVQYFVYCCVLPYLKILR